MKYTFNGRTVNIPDEFISRTKRSLGCNVQEAINIYLSDEGYIENDVVRKLTNKAKNGGQQHRAETKGGRKPPTRKPDEYKREMIQYLRDALAVSELCGDVVVTNIERVIQFTKGDDTYEVTLSRKRKPK